MSGRQVEFDDYDIQRLSRWRQIEAQLQALREAPAGQRDPSARERLVLEKQAISDIVLREVVRALNIEPPAVDDTAPAQVDIVDQALDIIRAAQRDLGEDLGGSVVDLLLDNLPIDRAAALALIKQIQARGDVRLHLCDTEWNDLYKTGQPVALMHDDGTLTYTRTSSLAWMTPSGAMVVYVEGSVQQHLLSRIQPLDQAVPS